MNVTADTLTRLRGNRANLERSRQVHADWIEWLKTASVEDRERASSAGDSAHHEQAVALYDERIACIDIAIELARAALAAAPQARTAPTVPALDPETVEAMRAALEPFAAAAEHIPAEQPDTKVVASVPAGPHAASFRRMAELLTAGAFRRAAAIRAQIGGSDAA